MRRAFTFLRSDKLVSGSAHREGKSVLTRRVSQNIFRRQSVRRKANGASSGTYCCLIFGASVLLVALFLNVDAIAGFVEVFVGAFSVRAFLLLSVVNGKLSRKFAEIFCV
jgi:hypothetical protein